jgi:hypothetical protein
MRLLLLTALLALPTLSQASPAEEPEENTIPILESTEQFFGMEANSVANRLDLFFADQRADDELARSRIRVRQTYLTRERAIPVKETRISLNIRLPNLEDRFRFDWFKDEDEETKADRKKKKLDKKLSESKKSEIKLSQQELDKQWQFRSTVGASAKIPPTVNFANRLRKNFETGEVINRFVTEVNWFSDRDWEQNLSLDNDLKLGEEVLFRFRNAADWRITRKEFRTDHGPSLRHRISDHQAMSYAATLRTTVENGTWYVTNYTLSPTYRRNLYHHWIYLDVTPGLDFPKEWSFRRTPFIFMQLEVLFGDNTNRI